MNITSFESLRSQFPITETWAYLQSPYRGILPTSTINRVQELLHDHALRGADARDEWFDQYSQTGAKLAKHLGTRFANVVYTPNTAWTLSLIANGMEWRSGDEVLIPGGEFPSNVYPWMQLERLGVGVRVIPPDEQGRTAAQALIDAIQPNTRLIAVSHVNFVTGYRMDVAKLAAACRERGVICVVDAAQSVGWSKLPVEEWGVDVLTGVGRKFLCALDGLAFLYIRPELADRLRVSAPGPFSVVQERDYLDHRLDLKSGAQKFANGGIATPQVYALDQSIAMLESLGIEAVEKRALELATALRVRCSEAGVPCLGQDWGPHEQSAVVTLDLRGGDSLRAALRSEHISASVRLTGVRVGLHAFNNLADVDRLVHVAKRFSPEN